MNNDALRHFAIYGLRFSLRIRRVSVNETAQNYDNHVRNHWPYHFVLIPIMVIYLIWSIIKIVMSLTVDNGVQLLLAIGLIVMALFVRTYALKAQDRVIRLEERLRFERILSA